MNKILLIGLLSLLLGVTAFPDLEMFKSRTPIPAIIKPVLENGMASSIKSTVSREFTINRGNKAVGHASCHYVSDSEDTDVILSFCDGACQYKPSDNTIDVSVDSAQVNISQSSDNFIVTNYIVYLGIGAVGYDSDDPNGNITIPTSIITGNSIKHNQINLGYQTLAVGIGGSGISYSSEITNNKVKKNHIVIDTNGNEYDYENTITNGSYYIGIGGGGSISTTTISDNKVLESDIIILSSASVGIAGFGSYTYNTSNFLIQYDPSVNLEILDNLIKSSTISVNHCSNLGIAGLGNGDSDNQIIENSVIDSNLVVTTNDNDYITYVGLAGAGNSELETNIRYNKIELTDITLSNSIGLVGIAGCGFCYQSEVESNLISKSIINLGSPDLAQYIGIAGIGQTDASGVTVTNSSVTGSTINLNGYIDQIGIVGVGYNYGNSATLSNNTIIGSTITASLSNSQSTSIGIGGIGQSSDYVSITDCLVSDTTINFNNYLQNMAIAGVGRGENTTISRMVVDRNSITINQAVLNSGIAGCGDCQYLTFDSSQVINNNIEVGNCYVLGIGGIGYQGFNNNYNTNSFNEFKVIDNSIFLDGVQYIGLGGTPYLVNSYADISDLKLSSNTIRMYYGVTYVGIAGIGPINELVSLTATNFQATKNDIFLANQVQAVGIAGIGRIQYDLGDFIYNYQYSNFKASNNRISISYTSESSFFGIAGIGFQSYDTETNTTVVTDLLACGNTIDISYSNIGIGIGGIGYNFNCNGTNMKAINNQIVIRRVDKGQISIGGVDSCSSFEVSDMVAKDNYLSISDGTLIILRLGSVANSISGGVAEDNHIRINGDSVVAIVGVDRGFAKANVIVVDSTSNISNNEYTVLALAIDSVASQNNINLRGSDIFTYLSGNNNSIVIHNDSYSFVGLNITNVRHYSIDFYDDSGLGDIDNARVFIYFGTGSSSEITSSNIAQYIINPDYYDSSDIPQITALNITSQADSFYFNTTSDNFCYNYYYIDSNDDSYGIYGTGVVAFIKPTPDPDDDDYPEFIITCLGQEIIQDCGRHHHHHHHHCDDHDYSCDNVYQEIDSCDWN